MHAQKHSKWLTSIAAAGSLLLGAHFVKTALFLAPTSLLGIEYSDVGARYFSPLFTQSWALFAPDPPLRDFYVEYKCRDAAGNESPWVSGYGDLLEEHRSQRLTPASYLRRVNRSVAFGVLGTPDHAYDALVESLHDPESATVEYVAAVATQKKRYSLLGRQTGYRLAWHYCAGIVDDLEAVRVRVPSSDVPKFTERNAMVDRKHVAHAIPWMSRGEIDQLPSTARDAVVTTEEIMEMIKVKQASRTPQATDADGRELPPIGSPSPISDSQEDAD